MVSRASNFFAYPVLGFRLWTLSKAGVLSPAAWNGSWSRGANRAVCHTSGHRPPVQSCGCGLYGLFDDGSSRFRFLDRDSGHALGAIAAWGDMEVHWEGFRAQYACVVALTYPRNASASHFEKLERAAERYGVELVPRERLREAGLRHGQWLPGLAPRTTPSEDETVDSPRGSHPRARLVGFPRPAPDPPETPPSEGIWLQGHVAVQRRAGGASISLTPSLSALLEPDSRAVLVANGSRVEEGDALAVIRSGVDRLVIRTPVSGRVEKLNLALARGEVRSSVAGQGVTIARIRCNEHQLDRAQVAWGRQGRQAYRSYLRSLHDDAGILDSLSFERHRRWTKVSSWGELSGLVGEGRRQPEHPIPDKASIHALARLLSGWISEDDHLREGLSSLDLTIKFRIEDRDAELSVTSEERDGARVRTDPSGAEASVTLTMSAERLHRYLLGELDLVPALGVEVGLGGKRLDAILASSLLQRLFPRYREHVALAEARHRRALAAA